MHKNSNALCQNGKKSHAVSQASSDSEVSSVSTSNLSEPTNATPDAIKISTFKATWLERKKRNVTNIAEQ